MIGGHGRVCTEEDFYLNFFKVRNKLEKNLKRLKEKKGLRI